jgi:hypothetical protein
VNVVPSIVRHRKCIVMHRSYSLTLMGIGTKRKETRMGVHDILLLCTISGGVCYTESKDIKMPIQLIHFSFEAVIQFIQFMQFIQVTY